MIITPSIAGLYNHAVNKARTCSKNYNKCLFRLKVSKDRERCFLRRARMRRRADHWSRRLLHWNERMQFFSPYLQAAVEAGEITSQPVKVKS